MPGIVFLAPSKQFPSSDACLSLRLMWRKEAANVGMYAIVTLMKLACRKSGVKREKQCLQVYFGRDRFLSFCLVQYGIVGFEVAVKFFCHSFLASNDITGASPT
jgi:hypothetical protein